MTEVTERIGVLVASPDAATRARVRLALGDERFAVFEADDVDAAVLALASALPAVMLLDLALPAPGALALATTARQQPDTARARTVLLHERAAQLPADLPGIDETLTLPASPFAVLRKVDGLLADD